MEHGPNHKEALVPRCVHHLGPILRTALTEPLFIIIIDAFDGV